MSFIDDLIGMPPKKRRVARSAETVERHRASRKANAVERYRQAFEHFGYEATTTDLARFLGYHPSSLGQKLKQLDNVEIVGTQPTPFGRPVLVWKWN